MRDQRAILGRGASHRIVPASRPGATLISFRGQRRPRPFPLLSGCGVIVSCNRASMTAACFAIESGPSRMISTFEQKLSLVVVIL
jgi:hypothetical protein